MRDAPTPPDGAELERRLRAHRSELIALGRRHRALRFSLVAGSPSILVGFSPNASLTDHIALDDAVARILGVPGAVIAEGSPAAAWIAPADREPL